MPLDLQTCTGLEGVGISSGERRWIQLNSPGDMGGNRCLKLSSYRPGIHIILPARVPAVTTIDQYSNEICVAVKKPDGEYDEECIPLSGAALGMIQAELNSHVNDSGAQVIEGPVCDYLTKLALGFWREKCVNCSREEEMKRAVMGALEQILVIEEFGGSLEEVCEEARDLAGCIAWRDLQSQATLNTGAC